MSGARAYIPVCLTAGLLLISSSLFLTFTCPWLSQNVSPAFPPCVGITFLFVAANFTMATFTDAGVLPRANEDEDKDDNFHVLLYKDVAVRGIQVRMKWCASCHFYRPPRCSHCSVCDHCVEDFDHHCPWVNNCIGRRNYRFFFLFLLSLSVHMVVIFSGGLLYVLEHLDDLWELQAAITLAIMSTSGLFFIPVMGLACFHVVLVLKGRTTNEQVTGKFQRGANPFTHGCCGNVEFILCSPITPRYTQKLTMTQAVHVQPPFRKPESSQKSPVKVEGKGVQNETLSVKRQSSGSLDIPEFKRLNTPPALPPKPDPALLRSHLATLQEGLLLSKTAQNSSTVLQSLESPTRVRYQVPREQRESQHQMSAFTQDWFVEPRLDRPEKPPPVSAHLILQPSTLPLSMLTMNSRSLSLKHAHRRRVRALGQHPESLVSSSSSSSQGVHSLSYDSLLNPSELMQHGAAHMSYLPSYLPIELGLRSPSDTQNTPAHTCTPMYMGTSRQSPVLYDSISKHAMSSIQEEREKTPQALQLLPLRDTGIYDTPSACVLPSRGPTPPAYGSREFLLSSAAYGHASLLRRAPRTAGSPTRGNQSRSLSPSTCRALEQQHQSSASCSMACPMPSSSYTTQKALAFITNSERKDSTLK